MLLNKSDDPDYQHSVLDLVDIAFSLAWLRNKFQTQYLFQEAQKVMFRPIKEACHPSQEEGNFLLQCVDQADYHFGIQHQALMIEAIVMAEQMKVEGVRLHAC